MKAKRRIKSNFISHKNEKKRYYWTKRHRHFNLADWRKWVFSDETRVNMWGSDGNSYYWSGHDTTLQPHQTEPHF